jgi:transcriptional regulator with XRE-family HTH domain
MTFRGERLRELREKQRLTQREFAELSGINEVQLSRYETGKIEPSLKILATLATHLEVSSDYLLGLSDDPHKRYGDSELDVEEVTVLETWRHNDLAGVLRLIADRIEK